MSITTPTRATRAKKSSSGGCQCRVPISELSSFGTTGDALKFYESQGIDVRNDYKGRLSIPVADAQRLYERDAEKALAEVEKQRAFRAAVDEAQKQRERWLSDAMSRLVKQVNRPANELFAQALREVALKERDLPDEIRAQLTHSLFMGYRLD